MLRRAPGLPGRSKQPRRFRPGPNGSGRKPTTTQQTNQPKKGKLKWQWKRLHSRRPFTGRRLPCATSRDRASTTSPASWSARKPSTFMSWSGQDRRRRNGPCQVQVARSYARRSSVKQIRRGIKSAAPHAGMFSWFFPACGPARQGGKNTQKPKQNTALSAKAESEWEITP